AAANAAAARVRGPRPGTNIPATHIPTANAGPSRKETVRPRKLRRSHFLLLLSQPVVKRVKRVAEVRVATTPNAAPARPCTSRHAVDVSITHRPVRFVGPRPRGLFRRVRPPRRVRPRRRVHRFLASWEAGPAGTPGCPPRSRRHPRHPRQRRPGPERPRCRPGVVPPHRRCCREGPPPEPGSVCLPRPPTKCPRQERSVRPRRAEHGPT